MAFKTSTKSLCRNIPFSGPTKAAQSACQSSSHSRRGPTLDMISWSLSTRTTIGVSNNVTQSSVGSVFFFILLSNWLGLLPGTGSITVGHNFLLRPANTDLNLTLAMALVSVISSHVFGFLTVGFFTHVGKFIQIKNLLLSFTKGPIAVFQAIIEFGVGLLEIVSEAAKIVSLSLRLFGNIFAGEVLISVISALVVAVVPTPFMMLELLVGLIQASVFAMLTLVYLTVASEAPHGSEEH